jgi:hypothetical protein
MLHVLDTCVLKCAYIPSKFHRRCRLILSKPPGQVFIAEISVLEVVNALGGEYRDRRISAREFEIADRLFFRDIAKGTIQVRPLPGSEFFACRNLLASVGIHSGRNLSSQDGIIAYTARQLSIENKSQVKLLTGDKKFASMLRTMEIFKRLIVTEYLDPEEDKIIRPKGRVQHPKKIGS